MIEDFSTDNKLFSVIISRFFILRQLGNFIGVFTILPLSYIKGTYSYYYSYSPETKFYSILLIPVALSILIWYKCMKHDSPKNLIAIGKLDEALKSVQALYLTRDPSGP